MADQSFSQQQSQQQNQQQSNQQDSAAQNIAQTQENAAVLAQLNTTEELPRVDLDSAKDGPSFGRMAATILDAIVPGEGSFASMKITGTIPLYETGVMSVQLRPSLAIEASRNLGKIKVKIGTDFTLRAQAGKESEGWWPTFLAYFQGNIDGSLAIQGDDGEEIFNEFLLTLRMILESACDAANAPSSIRDAICDNIMTGEQRQATIDGMDKQDRIEATIGGGVQAGAETSFGSVSAKARLEFTSRIAKADEEDDDVTVTNWNKSSVGATVAFELEKLGMNAPASINFGWRDGKFDSWSFSVAPSKKMTLGEVSSEMLIVTDWLTSAAHSVSNAIHMAAEGKGNDVRTAATAINGISVAPSAIEYTAAAEGLKRMSHNPIFGSEMGKAITIELAISAGWSNWMGTNLSIVLKTKDSTDIGKAGVTPIAINVTTGDTLVNFLASSKKGIKVRS